MNLLDVSRIRKSYGPTVAVSDVSFSIRPGEVFGLLGPNGAGKTTTMSIIAGLLRADSGELRFRDQVVDPASGGLSRMLGVVPQDLAIYPDLTARENLDFFGRLYGVRGAELESRRTAAFDQAGLTQHADRLARTFSGGMKRRLNFAIALLHRPALLMLDEPTVGVDPQSRAHLLDGVRRLRSEGVSVLYASHYMEEVQAVCDRVAIVDHGRTIVSGTLDELLGKLTVDLRVGFSGEPLDAALFQSLPDVSRVEFPVANGHGERTVIVHTRLTPASADDIGRITLHVLHVMADAGRRVRSVSTHDSNLERLFLELTGHRLRD